MSPPMRSSASKVPAARLARALVLVALGAAAVACNPKALDTSHRGDAGVAGGLSPELASRVLARVGERTITLGDYAATLERMDPFDRLRYQSVERKHELLEEMIDVELLAQDARTRGLDKEPETQEAIRQILRDSLLAQAKKDLPPPGDIPADKVRAFYDAHKDDFRDPARRRVAHLVVKDRAAATRLLAEARKATPLHWGELVAKSSVEAAPKGAPGIAPEMAGDLGFVSAPGEKSGDNPRVPPAVRAAIFEIDEVGHVLDRAVEVDGTFHVLRLTGKVDAHERSFAEAERSIRVRILQDMIAAREKQLETELRAAFPVTIDDQALSAVQVPGAPAQAEEASDAGAAPAPSQPHGAH